MIAARYQGRRRRQFRGPSVQGGVGKCRREVRRRRRVLPQGAFAGGAKSVGRGVPPCDRISDQWVTLSLVHLFAQLHFVQYSYSTSISRLGHVLHTVCANGESSNDLGLLDTLAAEHLHGEHQHRVGRDLGTHGARPVGYLRWDSHESDLQLV